MKLYLISTCIKINKRYSIFHFKGYFQGEKINEVYIEGHNFHIGAEYLMKIKPIGLQNSSLYGKILKFKKLN